MWSKWNSKIKKQSDIRSFFRYWNIFYLHCLLVSYEKILHLNFCCLLLPKKSASVRYSQVWLYKALHIGKNNIKNVRIRDWRYLVFILNMQVKIFLNCATWNLTVSYFLNNLILKIFISDFVTWGLNWWYRFVIFLEIRNDCCFAVIHLVIHFRFRLNSKNLV